MRKRATARHMDSMQLSAVRGASLKRPFPVGASLVRRFFWGGPPKRALVLPLRLCKAFPRREAVRRTTSFSANGATRRILVRGGYSPPEPAKQGAFHAVQEKQGSMLEGAGTEQTCCGGSSLPFQATPPNWSHPANRPLVTEQEVLMGSKRSFGGTHVGRGTFRTQLQGGLQGVAKVLGALFLANALSLCSPPPALAPSLADATDIAGPDAFQKAQGPLMRIVKVVGALLLAAALALCTPRPVLAAQQRKEPASRSASTAFRGGNKHSGRAQSTPGGGPVKAVEGESSAADEGVAVQAVVEEASGTNQGGAMAVLLEEGAFTTSVRIPLKAVVDERVTVTGEGNLSNASGWGGTALGAGGEKAPAARVTNGVQRGGLAGGLGTRFKKAVDALKEPLEETNGGAKIAEHDTHERGGAAKHTRSPPSRREGSNTEAELASKGSVPSERNKRKPDSRPTQEESRTWWRPVTIFVAFPWLFGPRFLWSTTLASVVLIPCGWSTWGQAGVAFGLNISILVIWFGLKFAIYCISRNSE